MPAPGVGDLDRRPGRRASVRAASTIRPCSVCFAALAARFASDLLDEIAARLSSDDVGVGTRRRRRRRRPGACRRATSSSSRARQTGASCGASCVRLRAREHEQRARRAAPSRAGLALDVREEAVALGGVVLRAGLQHLDRARRSPSAACAARARRWRRTRARRARGARARRRPRARRIAVSEPSARRGIPTRASVRSSSVATCASTTRRPRRKSPATKLAQREGGPRVGQRVAGPQARRAEQPARLGVRELDREVGVHREHALVQPLEQALEPVALRGEAAEPRRAAARIRSMVAPSRRPRRRSPGGAASSKSPASIAAAAPAMRRSRGRA